MMQQEFARELDEISPSVYNYIWWILMILEEYKKAQGENTRIQLCHYVLITDSESVGLH